MTWRSKLLDFCKHEGFDELQKELIEMFIEDCWDAGDFDKE